MIIKNKFSKLRYLQNIFDFFFEERYFPTIYKADYLYGGTLPSYDRDVPKCNPEAGAPPCRFLDFTGITTARQFHIRMEELYHYWMKEKCNKEWQVHFEALLKRMRNSLFCADGSEPDHDGYAVVPPPPAYQPEF